MQTLAAINVRWRSFPAGGSPSVGGIISARGVSSQPITWTDALHDVFNECKASLSPAALLAHPDPSAPLALVTDVKSIVFTSKCATQTVKYSYTRMCHAYNRWEQLFG